MMVHRARIFDELDGRRLLEALRVCRAQITDSQRRMPITGDLYARARRLLEAMDDVVETVTGDRTTLWDDRMRPPPARPDGRVAPATGCCDGT